jgi:hypothetical protein
MSKDRDDLLTQAFALVAHWKAATDEEVDAMPNDLVAAVLLAEQLLFMVESGKWAKAVATVNGKENP